ncbi:MAG: hypothetical protein IJS15_02025 [Victivallales bacterium]|nr:hypothetical protein [Victivallales bacterium]
MLKDNGFMATITVGSAMANGGTLKAAVKELGLPNSVGGTLQVTPVKAITSMTVSVKVSSGTAYIVGSAGSAITSGASGIYFFQVVPNGAKVTLV